MKTEQIKVVLVDDHKLFTDGLAALLATYPHIHVIDKINNSMQVFSRIHTLSADIFILDSNMPGLNGLQVTRRILAQYPDSKILIISIYNERRHIDDFANAGAKGYVLKTVRSEELVAAVEAVLNGETWFPQLQKSQAALGRSNDFYLKTYGITSRELGVLRLIKLGYENAGISEKLNISEFTVRTHRKNISAKLGLRGRNELIRFALEGDL